MNDYDETKKQLRNEQRDSKEIERVYSEQVKLLYANAPAGMIANLVNSAILTFILWNVISHTVLIKWFSCNFLVTLFRYILVYRYKCTPPESLKVHRWDKWFTFGIACAGIFWSLSGIILFPVGSIAHQVFLAFVLAGMIAGAVGLYSVMMRVFMVFAIPISVPIIVRFFVIGGDIYLAMGGMIILFMIVMLATSQRMHKNVILSLKLQFENTDLITHLTTAKEHVENLNEELKSEIRKHKQADEELRESEKKYRITFQSIPDSITITRVKDGRYLYVNDGFFDMTGYSREEAIGKTPFDLNLIVNPADRDEFVRLLKEEGEVSNFELQYRMKDGTIFDTLFSARPIQYGDEECLVAIVKDITSRKRTEQEKIMLEKQLIQASKMEAVGTLAGGVAHDFNNLLQAIMGYTQMLLLDKEREDPEFERLSAIEKAANRASELTQQLLTFSRKVESKLRPVNLNQEVKQVEKLLKRTIPRMIDIKLHLKEGIRVINADPAQVEQVLMNLGVNARDAMPEGGEIIVETENIILDEEYCKTHLGAIAGEYVLLSVSDTGYGMDKETVEHIFEPFFTTKKIGKGTGLGLAMVYGIVKNHGGYIMCYSEPGEGTTFKIYFPAIKSESVEQESGPKTEEISGGHETVLLVDDEEGILDIGKGMLERFGYTAIIAESGEKAIEIYKAEKDRIDLVVLDLSMPGMGGHKCLSELREIDPRITVIIASGYAASGKVKE
ncbi:MAG: PAS domain S-box protein, partial [Deltaproteobacteria bacterium]|nr:PAS domain S-box protein [Deltaproteobacteria bacterium]